MGRDTIKFLVPHDFASLDLLERPGPKNAGGGLAIKYARVEEAGSPEFECTRLRSPNDYERGGILKNDIVFVDWMWLVCDQGGTTRTERAKSFIEIENPKVIYGSEFCISNLPRHIADQEIESADMITHNCNHLRNLYSTIGIYNSSFLGDPVPRVFYPARNKRPRVVCIGHINERKNSREVVSIFKALEGSGIERVLWGAVRCGGTRMWISPLCRSSTKSNLYRIYL